MRVHHEVPLSVVLHQGRPKDMMAVATHKTVNNTQRHDVRVSSVATSGERGHREKERRQGCLDAGSRNGSGICAFTMHVRQNSSERLSAGWVFQSATSSGPSTLLI